jgi:hypothetical protein
LKASLPTALSPFFHGFEPLCLTAYWLIQLSALCPLCSVISPRPSHLYPRPVYCWVVHRLVQQPYPLVLSAQLTFLLLHIIHKAVSNLISHTCWWFDPLHTFKCIKWSGRWFNMTAWIPTLIV